MFTVTAFKSPILNTSSKFWPIAYLKGKIRNAKNHLLNRPSKYKPLGELHLEIALKHEVKQSKNGKFPSKYKASPVNFETQISLRR